MQVELTYSIFTCTLKQHAQSVVLKSIASLESNVYSVSHLNGHQSQLRFCGLDPVSCSVIFKNGHSEVINRLLFVKEITFSLELRNFFYLFSK